MIIEGIFHTDKLTGLWRSRKLPDNFVSATKNQLWKYLKNVEWLEHRRDLRKASRPKLIEEINDDKWKIARVSANSIRFATPKPKSVWLEDRVWSLFFKMGFDYLSGENGANLEFNHQSEKLVNQIDVVALDDEVVVAVECKSQAKPAKSAHLQAYLAKFSISRSRLRETVDKIYPTENKRAPVQIMWLWDILPSDKDKARAKELGIVLLDEHDLSYYEELVKHLGQAAKYQFLADCMRGQAVSGLNIKVPALRAKMGKYTCYVFAIKPSYLLKIAYVSHRAKGKATDIDAYQRMVNKTRLKSIREYISENNIFPTNIVINLDGYKTCNFEAGVQEGADEGPDFGYLGLKASFGCAWVIDGQHRLFAYSGHPRAETSYLSVLAFEQLPPSKQAQLFIDINHKQKSVSSNLLNELFAELHWGSEDEKLMVKAIISKAVQALHLDSSSPLFNRIKLADEQRTAKRCITFTSVYGAINKPEMFIIKSGISYGPLWAGDSDATFDRCITVINAWFSTIKNAVPDWWELGAEPGGGLSMNDGVSVCLGVMRSVMQYFTQKGIHLVALGDNALVDTLTPFSQKLGEYLASFSKENREAFRVGTRGTQGVAYYRRLCEQELTKHFPDFDPPGLEEYLHEIEEQTKEDSRKLIDKIEIALKRIIKHKLVEKFGVSGDKWWYTGVPYNTQAQPILRHAKEGGEGHPYDYVDIVDYREIATNNWELFQNLLARGDTGNKQNRTSWIVELNDIRKKVSHASRAVYPTSEELEYVQEIDKWLSKLIEKEKIN